MSFDLERQLSDHRKAIKVLADAVRERGEAIAELNDRVTKLERLLCVLQGGVP